MSFEEFIERLKARISAFFNSENKFVRLAARLGSLALFAVVVSTIAPTIADELSSSPEVVQQTAQPAPAPAPSPTEVEATPTPSASPTPEAQITRPAIASTSPTPLAESSESVTVKDEPPAPLEIQPKYVLRIPNSVAVDPRARSYYLPHVYAAAEGAQFTMACISGAGVTFDSRNKQSSQNSDEGKDLVMGDQSGFLLISSTTARVVNLINSYTGLLVSSANGGLANKALTMRFVAVTAPVVDPTFCSAAKSSAATAFRPLGLEQSTVKGGGKLK
jgi:hypothetical protein